MVGNAPGASAGDIPWLKLEVASRRGNGVLTPVTTVQRINTHGGKLDGSLRRARAASKARPTPPITSSCARAEQVASAVGGFRLREFGGRKVAGIGEPRLRGLVHVGRKRRHALDQGVKILGVQHQ